MKIFKMNDCDWCAGEDLESVIKFYLDFIGCDADEALDNPHELSESDMDRLIFTPDSCSDSPEKRSFRDELNRLLKVGEVFPMFFASTEY